MINCLSCIAPTNQLNDKGADNRQQDHKRYSTEKERKFQVLEIIQAINLKLAGE